MELENLKINYHYFITDLQFSTHTASVDYFDKEYQNLFKDAWELIEKGKEYPTSKNPNIRTWFVPRPNDAKLRHCKTGIVLYINALNLSKTKPNGEPSHYTNCNANNIAHLYCYSPVNLSNNSSKLQMQTQDTFQDKYSEKNIKNTYEKAMQQEFKIEKRNREEKIMLILAKLKMLIEDYLEKNNKNRFEVLTKRYSIIKNMIK